MIKTILPRKNDYFESTGRLLKLLLFPSMLIFAIVFKHDAFTDGMSNFPTLFFFAVYGIVILFAIIELPLLVFG